MSINADSQNVTFTNNTIGTGAAKTYNDVYNEGTINLNAATGKTITFNDSVTGSGKLVLNSNSTVKGGEYHFNADLGGKLNMLNGAVIRLGAYNHETNKAFGETGYTVSANEGMQTYGALRLTEFNPGSNTDHNMITLDLRNGYVDRHDFGKVTQNASVNHLLDVDINAKAADWFTATSTTAINGQILLGGFNLLSGSGSDQKIVNLSKNTFRFAMSLIPGFSIQDNITKATGVTYDVQTVDYDLLSGNLIFNAAEFIPNGGTLDKVYKESSDYLSLASGEHGTYSDTAGDISTTRDDDHPYIVVLNGTTYFFNPYKEGKESSEKWADAVCDLAATGALAIKEVTYEDNYIFKYDGKYYTYSKLFLPKSVWYNSPANVSNYNYYETNGTENSYYNMILRINYMNAIDTTSWAQSNKSTADTYDWSSTNYPLASNINAVLDGENLKSVKGMIRFELPKNDTGKEQRYYEYTYTVPNDYERATERVNLDVLKNYITNKYFYNLSNSVNGAAVYNSANKYYNINVDFIGNTYILPDPDHPGEHDGGGAIYNASAGKLGFISGSFINNKSYYGGVLFNNGGTAKAIMGDFIGNIATKSGGVLRSMGGTIGMFQGKFIGNRAGIGVDGWGGAISNKGQTSNIEIILADFIANSASKGGGAIDMNGDLGTVIGDFIANKVAGTDGGGAVRTDKGFIGAITGDFIGNMAANGGAVVNFVGDVSGGQRKTATIGTITGDFIGNKATGSSTGQGGAIYNYVRTNDSIVRNATIENIVGKFINNSANTSGGAIYNAQVIERVSADFIANKANTDGGAIYNDSDKASIGLYADDFGDIIFSNNRAGTGTNKRYNDIYNNGGKVNLNAATHTENSTTKQRSITFNGTIEGEDGIIDINNDTDFKGGKYIFNNTVSGNTINLFNGAEIKLGTVTQPDGNTITFGKFNLDALTNDSNGGLIDTINSNFDTHNLGSVTLNSNLNLNFDLNLATKATDTIAATYSSGSGKIILSEVNLIGSKSWGDFTSSDIGTEIKILTSNSDSLQLGLSDELAAIFDAAKVSLGTEHETGRSYESILAETKWNKDYQVTIYVDKDYGKWGLAKTDTENDSLGFNAAVVHDSKLESMGDTLYLVNKDISNATKNFTANIDGATYTLTKDLDDDSASTKKTLNINGIAGGNAETLNLNNHTGFILADSDSKLNFNNITVGDTSEGKTPATTTIATITNDSATVGLNNAILNGNINSDVNYNLSIAGTSIVNGTLNNSNTTFDGTELTFNTNTFSNATLNVDAGTVNLHDGQFSNYTINKLVSNTAARYNIDVSLVGGVLKADSFTVGSGSSGKIHLGSLSVDLPTDDTERVVRIIYANNDNIQLEYDGSITTAQAEMTSDEVLAAGSGLRTTVTANDSIMIRGLQDTFKAWTDFETTDPKKFTFVDGAEYTIKNTLSFDANNKATIINNGTVVNNGSLSNLALTNNDIFTNNGTITGISLANSGTFTNNSSTLSVKGGSNTGLINGTGTLNIANGGTYANTGTGTINNNISNAGTLTSAAEKLGGTITNSGILNLSGELAKAVSGNLGTTKVDGTLSLNTGASVAGTLDMNEGTVTISGGSTPTITTHNIGKIVGNGNLNIDMNLAEQSSDKINLANASSGTLTINSVNIIDPTTTQIDKNFSVQVINPAEGSTIQLALSDAVQTQFASHEYISDYAGESTTTDPVLAITPWVQDFYETHTTTERTEYSKLGLSDDKSSITITERREDGGTTIDTSLGDTLEVVNQDTTLTDKSFKTSNANDVYTVKEELGVTKGNVTVEGVVDSTGESVVRSTINFNSNNGFVLDADDAALTLKNVEVENASTLIGGISDNNVKVVLDNVYIHDNGNGVQTAANIEIKGNSTIADDIKVIGTNSKIDINGSDTVNIDSNLIGTGTSKLNISGGTVNIGNNASIAELDTTLNDTTLNLANETSLNNLNITFTGTNNLNFANNGINTLALGNVNLDGVLKMQVDADLANARMDQITASTAVIGSGGKIEVSKINLMSPTTEKQLDLIFTDNTNLAGVVNYTGEGQIVYSPIYKYNTSYIQKDNGGYFRFSSGGDSPSDFNPAVIASPVAAQAGVQATINNTFGYAFNNADSFTKLPAIERQMSMNANYYAINESETKGFASTDFNENINIDKMYKDNSAIWFRPYTVFENIPLANGPKVDAISYGTLVGFDTDFQHLKNGWNGVTSGYIGYNGAQISYRGVSSSLNGGLLGATQTFYKKNFWTAITATTGASVAETSTMYGHDHSTNLFAGVGSKTGYNFEFNSGKFIIQPIWFMSYSFINTFDYTNAAGVRIKSKPLNTIQLNPSIRFIGNVKDWQPYAFVGMVWNIMDRTDVTANGVKLPEMHIRPYVQYGVGLQKSVGEHFTGFAQATIHNGGRNGIALTGGFRWALGKSSKGNETVKNKDIILVKNKKSTKKDKSLPVKDSKHVIKELNK